MRARAALARLGRRNPNGQQLADYKFRAIVFSAIERRDWPMVLVAFVLGALFAWVARVGQAWVEQRPVRPTGWPWLDTAARRIRALLRNRRFQSLVLLAAHVAGILILITFALLFLYTIQTGYERHWTSLPDGSLYFLLYPFHIAIIAAFVGGIVLVWNWGSIWRRLARLFPRAIAATSGKKKSNAKTEPSVRPPYSWLTAIVGIAAVTIVAMITLIIVFPDALTRVESIKVAGVEARFAATATTSSTARISVGINTDAKNNNIGSATSQLLSVIGWGQIDELFKLQIDPVRAVLLASALPPAQTASNASSELSKKFLKAFAAPLSHVLSCYVSDTGYIHSTSVQSQLALLATDWANFAVAVLKDPQNPQWTAEFGRLNERHYGFVDSLDKDLFDRWSRCGFDPTASPYGRDKKNLDKSNDAERRNKTYFAQPEQVELIRDLQANFRRLFSDGYVIIFIADMMVFGQSWEQANIFMEEIAPHLDRKGDALAGQMNFYYKRANARSYSENRRFEGWLSDLIEARSLAERILGLIKETDKKNNLPQPSLLERYYRAIIATYANDLLDGYVRDWRQGRRLSAQELLETSQAAELLQKWLSEQSASALLPARTELGWLRRVNLVANGPATLALYELMAGANKSPFAKDSCGRATALLNNSKRLWEELRVQLGEMIEGVYRAVLTEIRGHYILLANACSLP